MLPAAEMDQNVLGTVDDSFDPTIFNFIDVGNSAVSPGEQDDCFKWVDDFITSTELEEPAESTNNGTSASTSQVAKPSVNIQQISAVQHQQILQTAVLQQQQQQQQQQTSGLGSVIMAMGQPSQPQNVAVAASAGVSQTQLLQNQATILQSNLAGQHLGSPFILKTSSGTPIQLAQTAVTQSTSSINASPQQQQLLASAAALISRSITPNQSPSPLFTRSLTPSHSMSTATRPSSVGQPQVGVSVSAPSNLNLLQLQQSQQITQQVPLSNFVTNQQGLQGHAVLTAQGSNIVHTQNALIQNPNVVNVNVAHVLPNQLPQLQGTILQTAQGKILIQSPAANNQQLPQHLNLSTLSSLGQMAGGQPVHMAGGQAVQMAPGVGLGQPTVLAQPPGNVTLANSSGVAQPQPSFNLINLGGSQGQILVQRMPTSSSSMPATPGQPLAQGPILLRTVNGQQQLVQQPATLQPSTTVGITTTQIPQLVAQAGGTQNIPLQQLLAAGGAQSLRLVGQPSTAPAQSQATTTATRNVVLQPLVAGNQVRLVGQQTPAQKKALLLQGADRRRLAMASAKPGTVTLNLAGQNLSLQQLQSLQGLQLTQTQQQQVLLQQQQGLAVTATAVQKTVIQAATQQAVATGPSKKSKSKNPASSSSLAVATPSANTTSSVDSQNILSEALITSGIIDQDGLEKLMNGGDCSDGLMMQTAVTLTPTPPPPPPQATSVAKNKKKKKKKEPSTDVVQPVVLSSTAAKPVVGITTASATVVTTTISQASIALSGQAAVTNTYTFPSPATNISMATHSATPATSQPAIGLPAVALTPATMPQSVATTSVANSATTNTQGMTPVRGKHGPANMTKPMPAVQSLNPKDRTQLMHVQTMLNKLKEKPNLDEKEVALMKQLDLQKKKILAVAHAQAMAVLKQQQELQQQQQQQQQQEQQEQATVQGQAVCLRAQPAQATLQQAEQSGQALTLSSGMVGQPLLSQLQTTQSTQQAQLKLDVKPAVATPSTPVLQIQPKSNAKLRIVSPKVEPGAPSSQLAMSQDTKPVLMGSGVQANTGNLISGQIAPGQTGQITTGNVIMTMSSPLTAGQTGSSQPQMLRIQIGSQKSQAVGVPAVAVTATITTGAQQVVVQSPQKIVMAPSMPAVTVSTAMTASPAVPQVVPVGATPPRPVRIQIANQVLTLQLTPQQQEKLELHLSRMTLEQQQAFLQMQHHILAKLQLRADPSAPAQPAPLQTVAGGSVQGVAAVAPTVVAAVSATGDSAAKVLQVVAPPASVAATPVSQQQLPITVQQALQNSHPKANSGQVPSTSTAPAVSTPKQTKVEVPKSLIHCQLGKDQEHAIAPDVTTPFKDPREACRRLMRYHVYQDHGPTEDQLEQFDRAFEVSAQELIQRQTAMLAKFRHLQMEDSMRMYPTSEEVLISRMWSTEMQVKIREEKQLVENDPDAFVAMPMSYLEKDLTKEETEESEEEFEDDDHVNSCDEDERSERGEAISDEAFRDADGNHTDTYPADDSVGNQSEDKPDYEESSSPCYPHQAKNFAVVSEEEEEAEESHSDHHGRDSLDNANTSLNESFEASSPLREASSLPLREACSPLPLREASPSPYMEASPRSESSPPRESTTTREKQSCLQSGASRTPPPRSEDHLRHMVKLVIRNDGKGFTSKVVERRRSSVQAERRTLRSRSHSGHERPEAKKEAKKVKREPVTEEIEYIDVDNSKYNRGVSVTLERLPEGTSQVYGLSISNKASTSGSAGAGLPHRTSSSRSEGGSLWGVASAGGSKSISGKSGGGGGSGRKRRRESVSDDSKFCNKRERHFSGVSGSSCDEKGDSSFRDFEEMKPSHRDSPVREFYVGSAMESLEHFDSDDDCGPYVGEEDGGTGLTDLAMEHGKAGGSSGRAGPACSSPIPPVGGTHAHLHSPASGTHATDSMHHVQPEVDYMIDSDEAEGSFGDHRRHHKPALGEEGYADVDELIPESPVDSHGMHPPHFPEQIPAGLISTDRMFDSSPHQGMETSFELDNADPQGSMVNPQMQSAIDSILNGSGSAEGAGRQGCHRTRTSAPQNYVTEANSVEYGGSGQGRPGRSSHCRNPHPAAAVQANEWLEEDSEDDLDAAVQSILR